VTRISAQDVFGAALAIEAGERRDAYIREACGEDEQLRLEVQSLLQSYAEAQGFLESKHPVGNTAMIRAQMRSAALEHDAAPGKMIGRYKLLEMLGEGGFGSVWMAEQREPVRRRVALKLVKLGMDTKGVIARFEAERQALALMDHPNIAKVLDAGATETGRPYFVMELVRGVPIIEYCNRVMVGTRQRLELFLDVCNAIQHAHQKGIVHRDIKPSNILITLHDGRPVPRVIDFGIAKATNGDLTDRTLFTQHRQMIGTPAYMSPEQAEMSGLDVDTRSDIYSLGALLYELLTGTTPFSNEELQSKGFAEMVKVISEVEPLKPSSRLTKLGNAATRTAQSQCVDARKLQSILRGELDWIVMKCLEKDRRRRYDTVSDLSRDIRRHLSGETVLAAPPSRTYRVGKVLRRNRAAVSAAALFSIMLIAGLLGTSYGLRQALIARDSLASASSAAQSEAERARTAESDAMRQAYSARMLAASDAMDRWNFRTARQHLLEAPESLRGWEWRHMMSRLAEAPRVHPVATPHAPAGRGSLIAQSGDSYWTVLDDRLLNWDLQTGSLLRSIQVLPNLIRTSPLGRPGPGGEVQRICTWHRTGSQHELVVQFWDLQRGVLMATHAVPHASIETISFGVSDDLRRIAYGVNNRIGIRNLLDGTDRLSDVLHESITEHIVFHPKGSTLIVPSHRGSLTLLDEESLEVHETLSLHSNAVLSIRFSPDGDRAVTASADGLVRVLAVHERTLVPMHRLVGHKGPVTGARFSPDGRLVASLGLDRTVRIWDALSGKPLGVFAAEDFSPEGMAFVEDGRTIAASDRHQGTVRFWSVDLGDSHVLRGHASFVYPVLLAHGEATVISGGWDGFVGKPGSLRFWDAASGTLIASLGDESQIVNAADISPDGRWIAVSRSGQSLEVLDAHTGIVVLEIPVHNIAALRFAPDPHASETLEGEGGERRGRIATVGTPGLFVFDAATGRRLGHIPARNREHINTVAWSPDGRIIATAPELPTGVALWDAHSHQLIRNIPVLSTVSIAFSPDGQRLVTAGLDGVIRVWPVAPPPAGDAAGKGAGDGGLLASLHGHAHEILCISFSPDGKYIASGGRDNTIHIWDAENYDHLARFPGHNDYIYALVWSRDSRRLFSSSGDHTLRIWDTEPPDHRLAARQEWERIAATFEPRVRQLFDELDGQGGAAAEAVVSYLKSSEWMGGGGSLNPRQREIALQLALRTSIERRGGGRLSQSPSSLQPLGGHTKGGGDSISSDSRIPRRYTSPRARGQIVIDGRMDEAAWALAPWTEDFIDIEGVPVGGDAKPRPRYRTRAKMLWDDTYLYVAAEMEEPHVWWTLTEHDSIVYNDNDFEVFLDPDGDGRCYFEIEVNAGNTILDLVMHRPYREHGPMDLEWNAVGLLTAVHISGTPNDPRDRDRGWSVEMAIPWSALAASCGTTPPPRPGDVWRANFSRVQWQHDEGGIASGGYRKREGVREDNWVWSPQGEIDMHIPDRWGFIEFVEGGEGVERPLP
jgi:eukaryotic-like serine/threonine-protein kinase